VLQALQAQQDQLGRQVMLGHKDHKVFKDFKVHPVLMEQQGLKVCKVCRAQLVLLARKVRKGRLDLLVQQGHKDQQAR